MKQLLNFVLLVLTAVSFVACTKDEPNQSSPDTPTDSNDGGTVLVYMVANNNLGQNGWDKLDIEEMTLGMMSLKTVNPSRLLVYHSTFDQVSKLKQVKGDGSVAELRSYDKNVPSVSIERMREVIAHASSDPNAPLRGIVFWSHGSGWITETEHYDDPLMDESADKSTSSFGYESGAKRMTIPALGKALEGINLNYIYFDCCLMGTVEVAYELRDNAKKMLACATELPIEGAPYLTVVKHLFSGEENAMEKAAQANYEYYMSGEATDNSAAMVVVDMKKLDALAAESRAAMMTGELIPSNYSGLRFYRPSVTPMGSYDMKHFYSALNAPESWHNAYQTAVTYHKSTPWCWGIYMSSFSGLGSAIFSSSNDVRINFGYRDLQWFKDVVSYHPIFSE